MWLIPSIPEHYFYTLPENEFKLNSFLEDYKIPNACENQYVISHFSDQFTYPYMFALQNWHDN